MPMMVDLSHPLVDADGRKRIGQIDPAAFHSLRAARREGGRLSSTSSTAAASRTGKVFLFDAEQHNPRMQLDLFKDQPEMLEFLQLASHGQVMLAMFQQNFPSLEPGTTLLLDEPEMALSVSNQRRILKMLQGTGGSARLPHHLRDALAGAARSSGDLRHQSGQPREPQRAARIVRTSKARARFSSRLPEFPRSSLPASRRRVIRQTMCFLRGRTLRRRTCLR